MANQSILNAFSRMWEHIESRLSNKSDKNHTHSDYANQDDFDHVVEAVYDIRDAVVDNRTQINNKISTGSQGALYNLALGGSDYALIYSEDDNVNFRWKDSNGTTQYVHIQGIMDNINTLKHTTSANNNGRYFKFGDKKLMFCCKKITVSALSAGTAWGSMYETSAISLGNWAASFDSAPYAVATFVSTNGAGMVELTNTSATSAGTAYICRGTKANVTGEIHVIAFGTYA